MNSKRKVIVSISTSVDGYRARPEGGVAWLEGPKPQGNYGVGAFFKSVEAILGGRKTYSKGIERGMEKRTATGFGSSCYRAKRFRTESGRPA